MNEDKIVDIYSVYGRLGECVGNFIIKELAEDCAKNKGWYGGIVIHRKAVIINDNYYMLESETPIELKAISDDEILRKQTLDSLTFEQKRVLGLI